MKLSDRINISGSALTEINDAAEQRKKRGERVFNLSVGEPALATPEVIRQAAMEAISKGLTSYSLVAGLPELRAAAVDWLNHCYAADYSSDEVMATCGGKFGVYALLQCLVNSGDEVIIVAPYWVSYSAMAAMAGGTAKIIPTKKENGWKITAETLTENISSRAKVLILNNASNPTGALYSAGELKEILSVARERGLFVISDEVYSNLVYDDKKFVSCGAFREYKENVVVVQSCSKNFAMTGWRVGLVYSAVSIISALKKLQSHSITNTSTISQWAAVAALKHADEIMPRIRAEMQERRDILADGISGLIGRKIEKPCSSMYFFPSIRELIGRDISSIEFCRELIDKCGVVVSPGSAFGQEGYVRVSFGGEKKDIAAAIEALDGYIRNIKQDVLP